MDSSEFKQGGLAFLEEDVKYPIGICYEPTSQFGKAGLDIRRYYDPSDNGNTWAQTKKGVRIREELYPEFLRAVFAIVLEWGPEELKAVRDAMLVVGWTDQVEAWERCVLEGLEDVHDPLDSG